MASKKKANPKHPDGRRFKTGHTPLTPRTRPPGEVCEVLRKAGLTREVVERKVADIMLMNRIEHNELKNDPEVSNFDLIIISVVEAAQRHADCARMDNLLEKIFGKTVRIEGSVNVKNEGNVPASVTLGDMDLIQRGLERAMINANK